VALEGLDAVVFTAGIGENRADVRAAVTARLRHLDVDLDETANTDAVPDAEVAATGSRARVHVIRSREELIAARHARHLLR